MANIIIKNYSHYNQALGKYIKNKQHYKDEMKKGGFIPFEENEQRVKDDKERRLKAYDKPPEGTVEFLNSVKNRTDKKGNVKLSDCQIDYMLKKGAILPKFDPNKVKLPKNKGGFF